jgi:hypothetical protein
MTGRVSLVRGGALSAADTLVRAVTGTGMPSFPQSNRADTRLPMLWVLRLIERDGGGMCGKEVVQDVHG